MFLSTLIYVYKLAYMTRCMVKYDCMFAFGPIHVINPQLPRPPSPSPPLLPLRSSPPPPQPVPPPAPLLPSPCMTRPI